MPKQTGTASSHSPFWEPETGNDFLGYPINKNNQNSEHKNKLAILLGKVAFDFWQFIQWVSWLCFGNSQFK
jgi:hypothetical protein